MVYLLESAALAVILACTYQVGLWDRPSFEEAILTPDMYLLVAATTARDISRSVEHLARGTKNALKAVEGGGVRMMGAATAYGSPAGSENLGVGLYFDDPHITDSPRWGIGWAVQVDNDEEFRKLHDQVQNASKLEEPIRAVKVAGNTKVLKGRLPWRNIFTPMIGPMLHWGRAFDTYEKGDYESFSGRDDEGSIAFEVYVTGVNGTFAYIDYIVLMGDTRDIFDAMFPLPLLQPDATTESRSAAIS